MILTQENLFKQIADREDIDVTIVRQIFDTAENIIFAYLSSTAPSEERTVKLLNGISLGSEYVSAHCVSRGIFENCICSDKIKVRAKVTSYYNKKINMH